MPEHGLVLADQVRLPVNERAALRTSAAHVFVDDLRSPAARRRDQHHLARVLRLRDGEVVTVGDGRGSWRTARWHRDGPLVDGPWSRCRPPPTVTIAAAIPKGDRLELDGAEARRGRRDAHRAGRLPAQRRALARRTPSDAAATGSRRVAREAAMQSRRVWLPTIDGPVPVSRRRRVADGAVLADPDGDAAGERSTDRRRSGRRAASPRRSSSCAPAVSLGEQILRVETAAVVAAILTRSVLDVSVRIPVDGHAELSMRRAITAHLRVTRNWRRM